jgi:replicative DNA helicase
MAQAQTAAHVPPQNLEAEESVLGAMMVSEGAIPPVILDVRLHDEDFYRDRHRITFGAIKALYERSEPIDALTVTELLAQRGELEDAGGKDAVSTLASTVPAAGNARHYAQIVKQNALLRRLLVAAQTIQTSVHERDGEPEELVEGAERLLFKVAHEERASDFRQVAEVLAEEIDKLEALSRGDGELTGVPSGFRDLDDMTGGFQPGNLIVVAARPAMGKCLTGSALVYDPTTGKRRRMDGLVEARERGEEIWVASLAPDFKLRPAKVSAVHRNGVKRVYRVTTCLGRRIDATANHPLLTVGGWKRVDEVEAGDRIGVPRDPSRVLRARVPANATAVRDRLAQRGRGGAQRFGSYTAQKVGHPPLYHESDVWWDEIASIEPIGEEETYDLTVPEHHNFVADDLIVHNSALVANIAEHVSVKHRRPVALFSLEMSETELAHRFIAGRARISSDRLRKGKVAAKDWPGVVRACNELELAPMWIDDSSDVGLLDLRAKARRLHASEGGLGLVIVDYLQLMRPEDPRQNRVEQVAQISRGLKILARELDIPVVGISQLSRAPEQRPDKRPILSDLRESGNIEQDSDLVAFIYRDEYYDPESEDQGVAELILRKNRNGPTGTVRLAFLEHYPSFASLSRQERPVEQKPGEGPPIAEAAEEGETA